MLASHLVKRLMCERKLGKYFVAVIVQTPDVRTRVADWTNRRPCSGRKPS